MKNRFENRVVIVTGAASGIGASASKLFAEEGASVLLTDIEDEAGQAVVDEIKVSGGVAEYMHVDVSDAEQMEAQVARVEALWGGLDVMFNNAAGVRLGGLLEIPVEDFIWSMDHAIKPYFLGARFAVPALQRRGGGAIVNTASIAGLAADRGLPAHVTCKHAVVGLTKSLAVDFARDNIRTNAICPGATRSPIMATMLDSAPKYADAVNRATPQGRACEPEEQAKVALFLASDDASYLNGCAIRVDGGLLAHSGIQIDWDEVAPERHGG